MRARTGVLAIMVVGLLTFASLSLVARGNRAMAVEVDGRTVPIKGLSPKVADAIARAKVPAMPGALRAVVSGRVLVADANPATITVNGRPATVDTRLRRDDRVQVVPGADTIEAVDERRVPGPTPGLPDVEASLWRPGRPRVELQVVGRMSGEIVSTKEVDPGAPASPETGKVVALSFDDGPDPQWTPAVMAILAQEGVHATFCPTGSVARRFPDLARSETAAGHSRCDHTIDHSHLPKLSHDGVVNQIKGAADILASIDGTPPLLFRPPYGELTPDVIAVSHAAGMRVLKWNVDSQDYNKPSPPRIVSNVMTTVQPGSVILMHDGGGDRSRTVAALRPIIRALKAQGYTFATPLG